MNTGVKCKCFTGHQKPQIRKSVRGGERPLCSVIPAVKGNVSSLTGTKCWWTYNTLFVILPKHSERRHGGKKLIFPYNRFPVILIYSPPPPPKKTEAFQLRNE